MTPVKLVTDETPTNRVDDDVVLAEAMVAVRKASVCHCLTPSSRRCLEKAATLLEIYVTPRGVVR